MIHFLLVSSHPGRRRQIIAAVRERYSDARFVEVGTAGELAAALDRHACAMVLAEYGLDDLAGDALLAAVRRLAPELPIVLVDDSLAEGVGRAALESGVHDIVLTRQLYRLPHAIRTGLRSLPGPLDAPEPAAGLPTTPDEAISRTVFEAAPIGIAVARGGVTVDVNPAYLRLFGYARAGEVIGQPLLRDIAPQERARIAEHIRRREADAGAPSAYETVGQRTDGTQFPFYVEVARAAFADGLVSVAFFSDSTARRQAEDRLRLILTSIGDGVIATDSEGRVSLLNPVAEALTGWPEHDAVGRPLDDVFVLVDEVTRAAVESPAAQVLRTGAVVGMANRTTLIARDGRETPLDDSAAPIRDADGLLAGVVLVFRDVAERRRAEAALREQEALFRTTADSAPVLIWVADTTGGCTFFNQPWLTFTGRTMEQELGDGWAENVHPDDFARCLQVYRDAFDARQPFTMDYRLCRADGVYRWIFDTGTPRWTRDGEFLGYIGSCVDITERKEAEVRSRFLYQLLDATRALSDSDTITATAARLLGEHLGVDRCAYAEVELDEDRFTITGDYITPGTASIVGAFAMSAFGAEALRLMRAGQPYVVADVARDPRVGGEVAAYTATQIAAVVSVPLHKNGRFVAGMAVHQRRPRAWTAADVELVQLVANLCWESIERARAVRALRESEQKFRTLAEAAPALIWFSDPNGDARYLNRRYREFCGKPEEALVESGWQPQIHPDDAPAYIGRFMDAVRDRQPYHQQARMRRHDGAWRWIDTHALPLFADDGTFLGHVGVSPDVTDLVTAEQALRANEERLRVLYAQEQAARKEAEAASQLKDEFLATISHELRTPLTPILGYGQLLQSGGRDMAYVARTAEKIVRSAKAQAQLIDDLLDVSRIVTGKLRISPRPIDLIPVIRAAIEAVRPAIDARGLRLTSRLSSEVGLISGDPDRLQQVVWNLLSNAAKFTPPGGSVEIELAPHPDGAEIVVRDTGQGISPAFLPYVFDRFRQADSASSRSFGGLGLGLAIVRHLVEMHGGTVEAASAGEGQGATFCVRLLRGATRPAEVDAPEAAPAAARLPDLTGVRVLLVDDQPDILEFLSETLASGGADVRGRADAVAALALLRDWRPDVLISDIAMPAEDGYWLIRQVRALAPAEGGTTPAIALTAYARAEDQRRVLSAGFQRFVPKPVEAAVVCRAVEDLARGAV